MLNSWRVFRLRHLGQVGFLGLLSCSEMGWLTVKVLRQSSQRYSYVAIVTLPTFGCQVALLTHPSVLEAADLCQARSGTR